MQNRMNEFTEKEPIPAKKYEQLIETLQLEYREIENQLKEKDAIIQDLKSKLSDYKAKIFKIYNQANIAKNKSAINLSKSLSSINSTIVNNLNTLTDFSIVIPQTLSPYTQSNELRRRADKSSTPFILLTDANNNNFASNNNNLEINPNDSIRHPMTCKGIELEANIYYPKYISIEENESHQIKRSIARTTSLSLPPLKSNLSSLKTKDEKSCERKSLTYFLILFLKFLYKKKITIFLFSLIFSLIFFILLLGLFIINNFQANIFDFYDIPLLNVFNIKNLNSYDDSKPYELHPC